MGSKAEIIEKEVILITKILDNSTLMPIIKIEKFNKCRFFKGTYSIKKDNWTYYCKDNDFYFTNNYCLIIDISKKEDALNYFFNAIKNKLNNDIKVHSNSILKLKKQLNNINKLENETNI